MNLPTDLQNLVDDFVSQPFKVGTIVTQAFWQNQQFGFNENRWIWLDIMEWQDDLELFEYKYAVHEYNYDGWRIVSQNGNTVGIQKYNCDMVPSKRKEQNYEEANFTPVGEIFERQVHEEIEDDKYHYHIVFRDAINSGNGPQWDDQACFCPEERFFLQEEFLSNNI